MKAVRYYGRKDVRVEQVPDPTILNPRDAIVKVMGEVVAVGAGITGLQVGDRVVVPFTTACGRCYFCRESLWSLCDNSNPNAWMAVKPSGYSGSGLFGYSHMYGGCPGGQAEYVRVPFADVGPMPVPDSLTDGQVLFLSATDRLHALLQ